jgi:hypothetical protein
MALEGAVAGSKTITGTISPLGFMPANRARLVSQSPTPGTSRSVSDVGTVLEQQQSIAKA